MPYTTLVAGTTITAAWANSNVRDQAVTPFASVAARTSAISSPVAGMISVTTDTYSEWLYNSTTVSWNLPKNRAGGLLAAPTVLTSGSSFTSGTTDLDLALDQVVTVTANRRIRLVFTYYGMVTSAGVGVIAILLFKESGTVLAQQITIPTDATNSGADGSAFMHVISAPSAGTHTYEVFLQKNAGAANVQIAAGATNPAQFYVEDVGGT